MGGGKRVGSHRQCRRHKAAQNSAKQHKSAQTSTNTLGVPLVPNQHKREKWKDQTKHTDAPFVLDHHVTEGVVALHRVGLVGSLHAGAHGSNVLALWMVGG